MVKNKLPKDWIAVNSKSHPDRMYYFNVKTNQTTWIEPTLIPRASSVQNKDKGQDDRRKHNKDKARALRRVGSDTSSSSSSLHRAVAETAQAKRKEAREKSSSMSSSHRSSSTKCSDKTSSCATTFMPQMRLIYNKKLGSSESADKTVKGTAGKGDLKVTEQASTTPKTSKHPRDKHEGSKSDNTERYRNNQTQATCSSHHEKLSGTRKKEQEGNSSSLKKNLAKERMQMIRKRHNSDSVAINNIPEKTQRIDKSLSNLYDDVVNVPSSCRNIDIRLKRLQNRVLMDLAHGKDGLLKQQPKKDKDNKTKQTDNMTKDELVEQANREVFCEEMDWEPMKTEEILLEVEVARTQLSNKYYVDEVNRITRNNKELIQPGRLESQNEEALHVVVDTNVFLTNLDVIEQVRNTDRKPRPFIVIPWTVICELDLLKDRHREELKAKVRRAITFIHKHLASKHPRFIGQTHEEAVKNKKDFSLKSPDDEILQCCLQMRDLQKPVILLSYDINLCNKAMIHNIDTLEHGGSLEKTVDSTVLTEELDLTDDVFEDTKAVMKNFLSTIVTKQMSEIYGATEWKMYVIIKPPWTVVTALKCAIKHWIAAVSDSFRRQSESILKELLPAFDRAPAGGRKLRDVEHILEKCSDLLQTVNMDKHAGLMTETSSAITELKKTCRKHITDMDQKKLRDKLGFSENLEEQENRAKKAFLCFERIYSHARDICGLACDVAGLARSFNAAPLSPSSHTELEKERPEVSQKILDLTMNLNRLLRQSENSTVKYETLLNLQQSINTYFQQTFDVEPLDIYYCTKLQEDTLKCGLRQFQDINSHFCALATR
ncbi:hypothetical protein DMN91_012249 [Ooceraea biroi]|uniref:Transcriptional protein SWT1 n=1 Tax=Ooceraea biroi TaxID=2015173 RepID=A0A026W0P2_OOCBI|nr:transcriptional protein SWT1 [Ooceraea biroi]EZA48629.1 Transcriptional protein SWT1 [Ooceraea biroi]RLU15255.1 hypothetical protein DMN91_012249 [Ooceraea biroi]